MATAKHKRTGNINKKQTLIRIMQINLQHSRIATDNLMNLTKQDLTDILLVQEPYLIQNKLVGITRSYRTYTPNEDKSRAAIIIANDNIDALLIKQLCDRDTMVIEVRYKIMRIIVVSMYLDIKQEINNKIAKVEEIIKFGAGTGIIIAMDSNARSQAWHDKQTNKRGRILEEYLVSRDLNIMNEESEHTTYHTRRGRSNIDLTITNNQILKNFTDWEISMDESCSDHNIIKYTIEQENNYGTQYNYTGKRYVTTEGKYNRFVYKLKEELAKEFRKEAKEDTESLDNILAKHIKETEDIETAVEKLHTAITTACDKTFKTQRNTNKMTKQKLVPWWTADLTIKRKRLNALRRRYQRTKNDEDLREQRKSKYFEEKKEYQITIKKEKIQSWKDYCNLTTHTNPWNAIYKIAANKTRSNHTITTLKKTDGTTTTDLEETLKMMADYLIPTDNATNDTEQHKKIRLQAKEKIRTTEDRI
jgi:hypothetical protein